MTKIRVLIADDHTLVREGLRALLEGQGDFEGIAEASNGHEAVDRALPLRPGGVLMGIGKPGGAGAGSGSRAPPPPSWSPPSTPSTGVASSSTHPWRSVSSRST